MSSEKDSSVAATPGVASVPSPPPPPPPPPPAAATAAAATITTTASAPAPAPAAQEPQAVAQQTTTLAAPVPSKPSAMAPSNTPPFSWTKPHPQFVIVLVGPEETPFSLHKDFLCAQSSYYRKHFATQADAVEAIVKLPDTSTEVFGFAQHFMYTDAVFPEDTEMPSYEALVGLWKLGHDLGIEGLCDRTLETMKEVQEATGKIPGPPLLVQVWRDAPEGSTIRGLLLHWAADYMRSSKSNAEFAKSLPQEVLSELVLAMSRPDTTPLVQLGVVDGAPPAPPVLSRRKMVHYLDEEEQEELEPAYAPIKKQRRPELFVNAPAAKAVARKAKPAPVAKPVPRRRSNPVGNGETQEFTAEQKLAFCSDLLGRMLSGPGFWTRLVGPFRDPVDPVRDGIPDYFEKVPKPMDLLTIKNKMDRAEYTSCDEFYADMIQIFANCRAYWKPTDGIMSACDKLEKTFLDKYIGMNKWLAKMEGNEDH